MEAKFGDVGFAAKAYTKIVKRIIDAGVSIGASFFSLPLGLLLLRSSLRRRAPHGHFLAQASLIIVSHVIRTH